MKKIRISLFALCTLHSALYVQGALAVDFPLSKYGQIQNVQSYSSNPFYNPTSPYNLRMPVPIYAQGTELDAAECRAVADALVAQQCATRGGCAGVSFSDIRPAVVIQMSNMSGHNYVSACSGYIQPAFEDYVRSANVIGANSFPVIFPSSAEATGGKPNSQLVMGNPFERNDPAWKKEEAARQAELRELQRQNGSADVGLSATAMPTAYSDIGFEQRLDNAASGALGYQNQNWANNSAYKPIKIEDNEAARTRQEAEADHIKKMADKEKELLKVRDFDDWCKKYPADCFKDLSGQLSDLNSGLKEKACSGKVYGQDATYKEWGVEKNSEGVWELKADAKTITLDDTACNKRDPSADRYGLAPCAKDGFGDAGASGETKACKAADGKDGTRLCTNGVWGECSVVGNLNHDDEKLNELIEAIRNSKKK
jgi:hypothetical protein